MAGADVPFTFTLSDVTKGNRTLPTTSLTIDATTTVDDLIEFVNDSFGIVDGAPLNPDGSTPGAQIDAAGIFSVVGNAGSANNIRFDWSNVKITDTNGVKVGSTSFTVTQAATADSSQ